MKYALFIDADGTLINTRGIIPQSAKYALDKAKENGHYLFLSTGRCLAEINQSILSIGFSGLIASAGCYVKNGDRVLRNLVFEQSDLEELLEFALNNRLAVCFEAAHGLYVSKEYMDVMTMAFESEEGFDNSEFYDFKKLFIPLDANVQIHDVSKISFMCAKNKYYEVKNSFSKKYDIVDSSMGNLNNDLVHGEIALKNIHKASAIKLITDDLNEDLKIMALGDSENDVEMLKYADIGIAMGNASKICKDAADEVTDNVDNDGLYKALMAHNLF